MEKTEDAKELRRKAEEKVASRPSSTGETDVKRLLHELQVHQVELEMQNDELRQANAEITEQKEHLNNIIKETPAGYFRLDLEGRFLDVNDAWLHMHGYDSADEVVGKHFSMMQVDGRSDSALAHLAELQKGVSIPHGEFISRRKDGSSGYHVFSAHPVLDTGRVVRFEWFIIDITERKQAEGGFVKQKYYLEKAQELGRIGTWELDIINNILVWTDENCRLFGVPPGSTVNFEVFIEKVHPEDREYVNREWSAAIQGKPYDIEHRIYIAGETRWVREKAEITFDAKGGAVSAIGFAQDITERKKAEEKYHLLFQSLLHEVHIWELVRDRSGAIKTWRLVDANPTALKSWNKLLTDVIGKTTEEIFPDSNAIDLFLPIVEKIFSENKPIEWERFLPDTNQYLSMTSFPMGDLFFSIGVDVAEQRQREEELKLSHSQLTKSQQLLEETGRIGKVGGWEVNIDTGHQKWTEEVYHIHEVGLDYDTNVKSGIDFYSEASKPVISEAFQRAVEYGEPYDLELEIVTAKGNLRNVHAIGIADLEHRRVYGFFQDITERKQIEAELLETRSILQAAMDQSPAGIAIADAPDGKLRYVNNAGLNIRGGSREAVVNGIGIDQYVASWNLLDLDGRHLEPEEVPLARAIMFGETNDKEFIIRRDDQEDRVVHGHAAPIISDSGEVKAAIVVFNDITQQKQSEGKRLKLEHQLRQSQKMEAIGTMAGGIAHDFNNILAIISGNLDLLQLKQRSGKPVEENLEQIREASTRAKNLVAQILAFSRQEHKVLIPVNLSTFVDESLKFLRPMIPTTVEVVTEVPNDHVFINGDTTQLQQVLINLCTNALHAMNGKGMLRISLEEGELTSQEVHLAVEPQANRYAKLSVADTGKGMDKKTLDQIFHPFFTTKEVGSGTGMGLSMVHGIIEQHGGGIQVDSTPGQGSTFTLYFPATGDAEATEEAEAETPLPTGTGRILFVDDEQSVANVCGSILGHLGYKVTIMTDSVEALDLFKAHPDEFDLVITDQTMPKMSGVELAKELLKIRSNMPIILCSGYSAQVNDENALEIGINAFCMKPVEMKQLAAVAREVLDASKKPPVTG